eukprot:TRINITY_DN81421_c0_g1_i1.p1 TRINITY_DN81421_c0_g1~~TRINITY_DN81421_c0_g1_i1.p1  ORF type:complete len:448 (+),score=72.80 TRINITY_DN81421_c0_g1_i1:125-1468(+)
MGIGDDYGGSDFSQLHGGSEDKAPGSPKAGEYALTVNLITATLGCGILSMPWATAGASIIPAAVLTVGVLALIAGTIQILICAAEIHQVFDLGGLLRKLPGRWGPLAQWCSDITIWFSVFLCLIGYIIVVADTMGHFFPEIPRTIDVLVAVALVLPLCFLDQQHLAFSSSLSIAANVYVMVLMLSTFTSDVFRKPLKSSPADCCFLGMGHGTVTMISVLMQAAVVQMCVLPMYEQLENRSPAKFAKCLGIAFTFVVALFVIFSSATYLIFGPGLASNILVNLPPGAFGEGARVMMSLAVLGVYPLLLSSMVAPLQHMEQSNELIDQRSSSPKSFWSRVSDPRAATFLIVAFSAVGATYTHDLGQVNVISGAAQVAWLVALAPGLVGMYLIGESGLSWRASMALLMIVGVIVSILGLTFRDNYIDEIEASCLWATAELQQPPMKAPTA